MAERCRNVPSAAAHHPLQLVDYDRHSATYTKLRDKKEKSLKDEQNLFKAEQDFETAAADYEFYNNAMKEEMPRFFEMSSRFVGPLWNGFYYMQYVRAGRRMRGIC